MRRAMSALLRFLRRVVAIDVALVAAAVVGELAFGLWGPISPGEGVMYVGFGILMVGGLFTIVGARVAHAWTPGQPEYERSNRARFQQLAELGGFSRLALAVGLSLIVLGYALHQAFRPL